MTQKDALLEMLSKQEWVCSTYFQASYLPEFRSLISRLNKYEGYLIIGEPCLSRCGKIHKSTKLKRWQWVRYNFNGVPVEKTNTQKSS